MKITKQWLDIAIYAVVFLAAIYYMIPEGGKVLSYSAMFKAMMSIVTEVKNLSYLLILFAVLKLVAGVLTSQSTLEAMSWLVLIFVGFLMQNVSWITSTLLLVLIVSLQVYTLVSNKRAEASPE